MPTINKQRVLNQLWGAYKKNASLGDTEPRPVLEQFIYGIVREGTTRERAERAYRNLQTRFFDWNEIRVSSLHEIEECLTGLPGAEARAERLISFLQEVFETTYSFDLEPLQKKGVKLAAKQLSRYQAANDYVVSWVIQQSLGGHAIPLDAPSLRTLKRLGLLDEDQDDLEALRTSLEHLVPKAKGALFCDIVSQVAEDACWDDPHCGSCPMASECPTGQEASRVSLATSRGRSKPR
jgi:endonuclease-3